MSNKYAGTKTEKNLWEAFAGESMARNKYTYFASAAKKAGYEQIAALFLAYLRVGASIMARQTDVTLEIVEITEGIIILLVVAEQFLSGTKHKMIAKEARKQLKEEEAA